MRHSAPKSFQFLQDSRFQSSENFSSRSHSAHNSQRPHAYNTHLVVARQSSVAYFTRQTLTHSQGAAASLFHFLVNMPISNQVAKCSRACSPIQHSPVASNIVSFISTDTWCAVLHAVPISAHKIWRAVREPGWSVFPLSHLA